MKKTIIIAISAIASISAFGADKNDSQLDQVLDQFHAEVDASLFAEKKKVVQESTDFNFLVLMGEVYLGYSRMSALTLPPVVPNVLKSGERAS